MRMMREKGVMIMEQIVINPNDLWQVIVAVCGGIIALSGAGGVIVGIVHKMKSPNEKQNERLTALEADIKKINERLDADNNRFQDDADKLNELEGTMKFTTQIIIKSLQALTAHAIDGNNINQLKATDKELNNYLIGKI